MIQQLAEPKPQECRADESESATVELVDGRSIELAGLDLDTLLDLQWEQETAYARKIMEAPKGSPERAEVISRAYRTVCRILESISHLEGEDEFLMGMDQRYTHLVLKRLNDLKKQGIEGGLFEVGFGSGLLLEAADRAGHPVGGIEVAEQFIEKAKSRLSPKNHSRICLGDFVQCPEVDQQAGKYSMVFWNDVFEHIPPDEIKDYLDKIHSLLRPGGQLITVTPNWHMRPCDVTADHMPPRTTAIGFHLKEYSLREVSMLLKQAGFSRVETPVFVGKRRIICNRWLSVTWLKQWLEPALEFLPYRLAYQICRRFGLNFTIATRT